MTTDNYPAPPPPFEVGQHVVLDRTLYVKILRLIKQPGRERYTSAIISAGAGIIEVGLEHLSLERDEMDE